jgi:purine-binding chemotaxis protein CheW
MENQIVVFTLGAEYFGVDISKVESIVKMQAITQMPQAPQFVEGITNLRGRLLPVMNLHRRFSLAAREADRGSRIIVVRAGCSAEAGREGTEVGMIVDAVTEVLTLNPLAVEPVPAITTTLDSGFITGVAKVGERLVILLDLDRVLSDQEQQALAAAAG